ncbi:hypothetical protein N7466_003211 [Penicillium verhagenii]|uniref:uncharacterized protein n=1 Tax=Penicillium verhagenii TaxID=1562060 RepID=UPI002545A0E7|nr:uncharacterized protein N7466_003211 [Penicillium verhagenii]KAJ5936761.1 hypothetical protein N7466_003211 [Penicillium verhagenii]
MKRQRVTGPSDDGLLRRAYADTIIPRVMGAAAKTKKRPFDQKAFKKDVKQYYGLPTHPKDHSFCHVLCFAVPASFVKAAHLVPKSLSEPEVSHIFGVQDGVLTDPRNGRKALSQRLWPSGAEYLHKYTLQTLARCVSGFELPDEFVVDKTFKDPVNESCCIYTGMILGADIRDTATDTRGDGGNDE